MRKDSLDRLAILLLPDPHAILLPELLALMRGAPDELARLELAHILVICCQALQPRFELGREVGQVVLDLFVGPFTRLKGGDEWEGFLDEE